MGELASSAGRPGAGGVSPPSAGQQNRVGGPGPTVDRYGEVTEDDEPERVHAEGLSETRSGPVGLLRDLQDLYLLASLVDITWTVVKQAGQGLRDSELLDIVATCGGQTSTELKWLQTRIKQAAPRALVTAG